MTSKFGLPPPRARAAMDVARGILRPLVARFPRAKARLVEAAGAVAQVGRPPKSTAYSVPAMLASLEASLRKLRCDRIDLFLVHEGGVEALGDDLRAALEAQVSKGAIGAWGIGSPRRLVDGVVDAGAGLPPVLQFEWSVCSDRRPDYSGSFVITQGAIRGALPRLGESMKQEARRRAWSERLGIDAGDPASLASVLLGAAAAVNPGGIVLFSSKRKGHVRELARVGPPEEEKGRLLLSMLAEEPSGLPRER